MKILNLHLNPWLQDSKNLEEFSWIQRDQWVTLNSENFTDFNTKVLKSDKSRNLDLLMITEEMRFIDISETHLEMDILVHLY